MPDPALDDQQSYYPPPAPSPLQQVAQAPTAPTPIARPQVTRPDVRNWLSGAAGQVAVAAPPTPPAPAPMPTATPSGLPAEAPQQLPPVRVTPPPYASDRPNQRFTPHALRPRPELSEIGQPPRAVRALEQNPGLEHTTLLPNRQEAYGVFRGGFKQMAVGAPPSVAGPANIASSIAGIIGPFLDFYSNNAFSTHYRNTRLGMTQEQEAQQKMQHERLTMEMERVKLLHAEMMENGAQAIGESSVILRDYAHVFNQEKTGAITHEQAQREFERLNIEHKHPGFDALLKNGGSDAVLAELKHQHDRLSDAWGAYAVLDKAEKTQREEQKEREKEEKQAEIEAPFRGVQTTPAGMPVGAAPAAAAPVGAAPVETAEGAAPGGAAGGPNLTTPALDAAAKAGFGNRAAVNDLAEKMLFGEFKPAEYKGNDRVVAAARQRETEMNQQLQQIRATDFKNKDDIYNAIGGVSPRLRGEVEELVSGAKAPPSKTNLSKRPYDSIYSMALKVDPTLDTKLQTRNRELNYFTNGRGAQEMKVGATAYDHGDALLKKLNNLPPVFYQVLAETNVPIVTGTLKRAGRWFPETEAQIAALKQDIRVFSTESGTLLASGMASTAGTEKERGEVLRDIDWHDPVAAKATVIDRLERIRERLTHAKMQFTAGTGMDFDAFMNRFKAENPDAAQGLNQMQRDLKQDQGEAIDYRTFFAE